MSPLKLEAEINCAEGVEVTSQRAHVREQGGLEVGRRRAESAGEEHAPSQAKALSLVAQLLVGGRGASGALALQLELARHRVQRGCGTPSRACWSLSMYPICRCRR